MTIPFVSGSPRDKVWLWYLLATSALAGMYLFVPAFAGNGPLINALGLSGVVAIVVGIIVHKPRARAAWWLFAAGQFLFFSGDLYTYSYPKLTGADVGFPSIGDALYLAVYPVLIAGLFLLIRRRNPRPDRSALIDALILTIGVGLLSWVFLIAPNFHIADLTAFEKSIAAAYPLGDVLLLAGAIRLAVDTGRRTPAFWLLVSSIVCLLAVDSAYNLALLQGTYDHQLIYDAGWIFYYLLWGAAALHPSMRTLEEPTTDQRTRLTPLRLTLLGGACLISPGVRFAQEFHNPDVLVLISGRRSFSCWSSLAWLAWCGRRRVSSRASGRCVAPVQSLLQPSAANRSLPRRSRRCTDCSAPSRRCASSWSPGMRRSSRRRPTALPAAASAMRPGNGCAMPPRRRAHCMPSCRLTCAAT